MLRNKESIDIPIFRAVLKILASPKIHKKVSLKFEVTSIRCFLITFFFVFRFNEIHMKKVTIIPNMKGTIRYPTISCLENGSLVSKTISMLYTWIEHKLTPQYNLKHGNGIISHSSEDLPCLKIETFLKSLLTVSPLYNKNCNSILL